MDPLTLAKLWLTIRPIKRWKEHRAAKRAAENQVSENVPVEAAPAAEEGDMSELGKSMLRSVMKVLGSALVTYAVTHGLVDAGQTDALTVALEALGGSVLTIGGLYLSHRTHKAV